MADTEKMVLAGAMVPESLMDQLKSLASVAERSVAGEIRLALRAHVDAQPKAKRKPAA